MQRDLTRGNVAYSLIVFSLPMILGNILQQCYNIADTLIVSYALGPDALAAVGSSFTLMTFITSIILGLSIGSGTLFSIRFGQRDEDGLKDSLAAAFFLIAILTIIITSLSYLTINLLESFLSVPKTIWPLMKSYLIFIYLGIPAIFLYNFFSSFLRALGESKTPLIFLAISTILNILLDIIFVLLLKLGVIGAATATIISQYLAGLGIMLYSFKYSKLLKGAIRIKRVKKSVLKNLFSFSLLTCLQQSVMNLGILLVQGLINSFGAVIMASYAIAVKIDAFAYMPSQEFGNAFSTFIAQNSGAKKSDRIRKGIKVAFSISTIYCLLMALILNLLSSELMSIFVSDSTIINEGVRYLRIEGSFYIGIGYLFLLYGLFRALSKPGISLLLTIISLGTRVVLAYILSSFIGVVGIWISIVIGWFLADLTGILIYLLNPYLRMNK